MDILKTALIGNLMKRWLAHIKMDKSGRKVQVYDPIFLGPGSRPRTLDIVLAEDIRFV